MAKKIRGWFARLVLGDYARVLDHAREMVDRSYVDTAIRKSDIFHKGEHEALRAEIEKVKQQINVTSAEVRAAERAIGVN